jgi:hypothetical protein
VAVLGSGGLLRLKREAPEPTVVRPGNLHVGSNSIYMRNPAFWSGDEVTLTNTRGLPIDYDGDGEPDCPDGYATYYGSEWYLGPNRDHITSDNDDFYSATDTDQFYMRLEESGQTTTATYYIYRDQFDRLSFYSDRASAMLGRTSERVSLFKVDFHSIIVAAAGTTEYQNAIGDCATDIGEYEFSDAQDEVTLESICDFAPDYTNPTPWITEYDNADLEPRYYINAGGTGNIWVTLADMSSWTLNMDAQEVETTSVGEKFGEAVKSVVTGGGSIDFFVDRRNLETCADGTALMQLLLLTEKGCKADAEFWMINDRDSQCGLLPGDLYYETQLLVTSVAINTRATEMIAGSLNFVTVGEIALRMGTN